MAKKKAKSTKKSTKKKTTRKKSAKKSSKTTGTKQTAEKKKRTPASPKSVLSSLTKRINKRSQSLYGFAAAGSRFGDIGNWVSTGCTPLDSTLWGGFPRGRIHTIEGFPSQGKSTLMESAFIENQRVGGMSLLLLSESCLDTARMARQGMDFSEELFSEVHVESVEQGIFYIRDVLNYLDTLEPAWVAKHPLLIGWDTPSNAQEQAVLDDPDNVYAEGMASKARNVRSALRTIVPKAGRLGATVLLLLQKHQKIGPYAGSDVDCGLGPKFNATLRLNAWAREKIFADNIDDKDIGIISNFSLEKSRASCPPGRSADVVIRSYDGIDNDASMVLYLRDVWCTDPCPTCGGKLPKRNKDGGLEWLSNAWEDCQTCNQSGLVFHLIENERRHVVEFGQTSDGNKTQWRYIYGYPGEEVITFTDKTLRQVLDDRPGLRTWLAEQCWKNCTKPEPPEFHQVEDPKIVEAFLENQCKEQEAEKNEPASSN